MQLSTKTSKSSRYHFLELFRTRVLDTHQGCHKAALSEETLFKFHISVGDRATSYEHGYSLIPSLSHHQFPASPTRKSSVRN